MKWMGAAHSILTFPLLFALSLFNEARVQVREFHIHVNLTKCVEPCGYFKPIICTQLLDLTLGEDTTTKAHDGTNLRAKHNKNR